MQIEKYVFISRSMNGNDCTTIIISAKNLEDALTKAYSYFGGRHPLTNRDFNQLLKNRNTEEQINLFRDFINETIVFLQCTSNIGSRGYVTELVNSLPVIDEE